ncbi:tRNA (adenosine(37)-N6)-dimethylallyltransferase MiaA [Phytoactinopolyspora mesophila]|uniref:tRNA (adenosine(37)-N6)-dimethylallyltransferase MiaA n=1 Tax=Phytoactinopolyspora mesophila TaxID=2650750 RepID=UPI003CCDBB99
MLAVVGPTAAGKSETAIDLAVHLGGEVINADSMQVYRGMDIGTAKVPPDQRRGVRHHLLDVLDVTEPATVAEFQSMARSAIADCRERGAVPVVVGGSALYIRAILDQFEFPGTDHEIRARLEGELATLGPARMHARLAERDPAAAEAILPSNGRRIVRALEVIELTGRPFAAALPPRRYAFDHVAQIGLDVPRPVLDQRIEQRVHAMWAAGLVDEVRALRAQGLEAGRTASRALGYAQVLEFLAGERSEDEAREEVIRATRRFARRQDSWFRKDERISWVPFDAEDRTERAIAETGSVCSTAADRVHDVHGR